jgi:hypothetical protein
VPPQFLPGTKTWSIKAAYSPYPVDQEKRGWNGFYLFLAEQFAEDSDSPGSLWWSLRGSQELDGLKAGTGLHAYLGNPV